jgi:transglutaminase-like putative cysteine protease
VSRVAAAVGLALVALGLAVFGWKVFVYDLPVLPTDPEGLWRVELDVSVRGSSGRGSVRAPVPSTAPGQEVTDERSAADRLLFTIRTTDGERTAIWRGAFDGVHEIAYGFRVRLAQVEAPLPRDAIAASPEIARRWGHAEREFPSDAPEIAETLQALALPPDSDVAGRVRSIFAMVAHEVATAAGGSDDALLALANRAGSERGKTALLVTLLRAAGVPARPVTGLELRTNTPPRETPWAEAWAGGAWVPLSPTGAFFALRPASLVALRTGSFANVETTGAEAVTYHYEALREHLRAEEVAAMMVPPSRVLRALSLYRLPVPTQAALRLLLVLPLGALIVAVFRNLIGVPTFGTFMPVLIAFALRNVPIYIGLAMVVAMIGAGVFGRLVLERLRLLLVPRLAILLCLVVLGVAAFAMLGRRFETREFFSGVLFPIVILTMLIERFSIAIAEEGMRTALARSGYSLLVTIAVYPVLRDPTAEYVMFSFPELTFCVMGVLVWIGGYTGYRLLDLVRFRSFAGPGSGPA